MKMPRIVPALTAALAALGVSGCVPATDVSRDIGIDIPPLVENIAAEDWDVAGFEVNVPHTLTVSEANSLKPRADIVWREDPIGDRRAQVDALMTAALAPAFAGVNGEVPVIVTLDVTRFHAQTQRVRYTLGGEHEIEFVMTVQHAETGAILSGPRHVDLTFDAYGGEEAVAADARGETQRLRISERLQLWVAAEFLEPEPRSLLASIE